MSVTFMYGSNSTELPAAVGQSASVTLPVVRNVMNVPSGATPEIDGNAISNDYVFKDGDEVVFYKASGNKGY